MRSFTQYRTWQKSVRPDFLQEKSRLKKREIYAVLDGQKNYELSFHHSGSLFMEQFIPLLDLTLISGTGLFRVFCLSHKTVQPVEKLLVGFIGGCMSLTVHRFALG
jgi:hypothetical protein